MREKDLLRGLDGLQDERTTACQLVFLHELSAASSEAVPPAGAEWDRISGCDDQDLTGALDAAGRACMERWPEHLDGFFTDSLDAHPLWALKRAISTVEKLAASSASHGGPDDRRTLLSDVSQQLRSLSSQQWQGAFFTPWNIAELMARMQLDNDPARELWVIEPAVGGAVMLLAALEVWRRRHGEPIARTMTMIGVDVDLFSCRIARASLILAGADPKQFWIFHGNSLAQPVVGRNRIDGRLYELEFHACLTNPPFGGKESDSSLASWAERGPLIVPDSVLYRTLTVPVGANFQQDPTPAQRAAESEPEPEDPENVEDLIFALPEQAA